MVKTPKNEQVSKGSSSSSKEAKKEAKKEEGKAPAAAGQKTLPKTSAVK